MSDSGIPNKQNTRIYFECKYNNDKTKFSVTIRIEKENDDSYYVVRHEESYFQADYDTPPTLLELYPSILTGFEHHPDDHYIGYNSGYDEYTYTTSMMFDNNTSGYLYYLDFVKRFVDVFGNIATFYL